MQCGFRLPGGGPLTGVNTMGKARSLLSLLLTAGLVLGCGFQLRGVTPLPPGMSPAYIQAASGSTLLPVLTSALQGSGVQMAASASDAKLVVRILDEKIDTQLLAVNRAGKAIAYEIRVRVGFDATGPGLVRPVPRQTIENAREYVNPDVEVLGKEQEASLIRQDLLQNVADHILRRLLAQLR